MNITTVNRFIDDTALLMISRAELIFSAATADVQMREHPYDKLLKERTAPEISVDKKTGIGTIPIHGVLAYKPDYFEMMALGMEDTPTLTNLVRTAAADQDIKGILLDVHSPGGFGNGVFDLADAVNEAGKMKPVHAYIGGVGGSAAYLVASQANEIMAARDAKVGSIGAFMMNVDRSRMMKNAGIEVETFKNKEGKFKGIGQLGTSLTDDHREYLKGEAQKSFDAFKDAVMSKRKNISPDAMQGQVFSGKEAMEKGLVDSNGSMLSAIARLQSKIR